MITYANITWPTLHTFQIVSKESQAQAEPTQIYQATLTHVRSLFNRFFAGCICCNYLPTTCFTTAFASFLPFFVPTYTSSTVLNPPPSQPRQYSHRILPVAHLEKRTAEPERKKPESLPIQYQPFFSNACLLSPSLTPHPPHPSTFYPAKESSTHSPHPHLSLSLKESKKKDQKPPQRKKFHHLILYTDTYIHTHHRFSLIWASLANVRELEGEEKNE